MIMKPSIRVNLPKAATGESSTPSQLSIAITADGKLSLNGSPATDEALRAKAIEQVTKNPDVQAIISADKDTPHGKVVGVIDVVEVAA